MIALYYDYTSLASVVAYLDLYSAADRLGVSRNVVPIGIDVLSLGSAIPATLDQHEEFERYQDSLAGRGFRAQRPRLRPPTMAAHLIADGVSEPPLRRAWDMHVFAAYWERGVDISDHDTLIEAWRSIGGAARIEQLLGDMQRHQQLRRRMANDRHRGIGGVPVLDATGTLVPALQSLDDLESVLATFAA